MKKVLCLEPSLIAREIDAISDDIQIETCDGDNEEIRQMLSKEQYIGILTRLGINLDGRSLSSQKHLKAIATPTTGLNHIDIEYCKKRGIKIISLKNEKKFLETISTTAEHAWLLLLSANREYRRSLDMVSSKKKWDRQVLRQRQIKNDTVGIIGLGRLGKMIESYSEGFGCKTIFTDIKPDIRKREDTVRVPNIQELIQQSDHVIVCADYQKERTKIISDKNWPQGGKIKTLINIARGELIDEEFIVQLLKEEKIEKYATDVLTGDSILDGSNDHEILSQTSAIYRNWGAIGEDRIIITPHCGGYAYNVLLSTRKLVLNKLISNINSMN